MRFERSFLLSILLLFCLPSTSSAQAWSGIISPARGVDWSIAGIPGGIPSGSWTQCGATINPPASDATINAALAACGTNQYVLLGPGTFNLSSGISFPNNTTGHVVLRGSGANSTFLVFGATTSGINCGGFAATMFCIRSTDGTYTGSSPNVANWTAGYAQGATQITLSSIAGIVPNKTLLFLNQCDTGYSGSNCATGVSQDNGQFFVCAQLYNSSGPTGCSANGPDGSNWRGQTSWQQEVVTVTAINQGGCGATCVSISQPLKHPNWSASQFPQAVLVQPVPQDGIENLAIDGLASPVGVGIMFYNAYQGWVSGVKLTNIKTWFINNVDVSHMVFQNNYLFHANCPLGCDPYGIRIQNGGDDLTINNIIQQVRISTSYDGPEAGGVVAYNYSNNQLYASDFMFGSYWTHSAGDNYDLWEGNIGDQMQNDLLHGSHLMSTLYRNFFTGWESCANGQCGTSGFPKDSSTNAIVNAAYVRYSNLIGNVLGTPGATTGYQGSSYPFIYTLGDGNGGVPPNDPITPPTIFRWGNWDTVTNNTRWCGNSSNTGFSTVCGSTSEVPSSDAHYPNSIPTKGDISSGQSAMPASFFLSSKPAWWGNLPWPAIGPDVVNGNIGMCSGALNTLGGFSGLPATSSAQCKISTLSTPAWGGHANTNAAMNCYLNVMGGLPDGTGLVLNFDPNACYGSGTPVNRPNPSSGLSTIVN